MKSRRIRFIGVSRRFCDSAHKTKMSEGPWKVVSETTECTPASPESTPRPSIVSTVKTSDVQNQELDQIRQDTNDSQPLIDSNNLSDLNTFTRGPEVIQHMNTNLSEDSTVSRLSRTAVRHGLYKIKSSMETAD
ncbi:hypothetical protein EVAR_39558_1 [Eumeta japonica]|uniref:Uncharacterized protein n=1 Tax=Eumeta variegata TaxID=151549 RepID=A0A4C1XJ07_EUMVA|nr:hypothetical protein EVAR_39558_1 [Eumeta japonica]